MQVGVSLAGEFGIEDLERLCVALEPLSNMKTPASVHVDLSEVESVCASALAVLVSVLRTARSQRLCDPLASLTPPSDPTLHRWLAPDALRGLLEHPADGAVPAECDGCGCEPFSSVDGIVRAREALLAFVSERIELNEKARTTVGQLLWDLSQNVLAHAEIGGGVAAACVDVERCTLEIAVADRGIGIRESFVRGKLPNVGDDASAVRAALAPGVTSSPGEGKGMGLYIAKLVLANNEGTLMLRSGNARVDALASVLPPGPLASFKGTLVTVLARVDRRLDVELARQQLECLQRAAS